MDRMAAAAKDASGDLGRLLREVSVFSDWDLNAPWSQGLFKAAVHVSLWDPPAG